MLLLAVLTGCDGPPPGSDPSSSDPPHVLVDPAEDAAPDTLLPFYGVKDRLRLGRGVWPDRESRRYDVTPLGEPERGATGPVLHWDTLGLHAGLRAPFIDRIGITGTRWRTREGVGVGSSFAEVMRIYGDDHTPVTLDHDRVLVGPGNGGPRAGIRYPALGLSFYATGPVLTRGNDVAAMELDREGNAFDAYAVVAGARDPYDPYGGPLTVHGIRPGTRVATLRDVGLTVEEGSRAVIDTPGGALRATIERGRVSELRGASVEQNGVSLLEAGDTMLEAQFVLGYEDETHDYPDRARALRFDGVLGRTYAREDQRATLSVQVEAGRVTGVTLTDLRRR